MGRGGWRFPIAELELGLLPPNLSTALFLLKLLLVPGLQARDLVGLPFAPPAFPSRARTVGTQRGCGTGICRGPVCRMGAPKEDDMLAASLRDASNLGHQTAEWEGCQGNSAYVGIKTHTTLYIN